jgi:hypothetical protein
LATQFSNLSTQPFISGAAPYRCKNWPLGAVHATKAMEKDFEDGILEAIYAPQGFTLVPGNKFLVAVQEFEKLAQQ